MKTLASRAARLIAAALVILFSVLLLPPWLPAMPASGLDPSWTQIISYGYNHGWQFGTELVMNYGPYGFLASNLFDPGNYVTAVVIWIVIALLVAAAVLCLAEGRPGIAAAGALFVLVGFRAGIATTPPSYGRVFVDAVFFVLPLMLLALSLRAPAGSRWLIAPLLAVVAMSGMIKFTFALLALPIVALMDAHRWPRRQFVPRHLLAFVALFGLFFALAGQRLANLPAYVSTSLQLTAGYSTALQVAGRPEEVSSFLGAAAAVLLLAALTEWDHGSWRRREWEGPMLLVGFAVVVFMAFKAGFVRHDIHPLIAWSTLAAAAPICASRQIRIAANRTWTLGMLAVCVYVSAAALSAHQDKTGQPFWPFVNTTFGRGLIDRAAAATQTMAGTRMPVLGDERERAFAALRNANPLPPLGGTADIYPWDAAVLFAYGMDYRPRPVFHSYSAFTRPLIAMNTHHLQSDTAPDKVLFAVGTIDSRFPSLDDAASWPELLARYDAGGMFGEYLLLQRRPEPRRIEYRDLGSVETTWSRRVDVPAGSGRVWASIAIDRTAAGALMNALFKVPPVGIIVQLANGRAAGYRVVPSIMREGFLLSPLVDSTSAFAALAGGGEADPGDRRVAAIELRRPADATPYYADAIRVTFRSLEIR